MSQEDALAAQKYLQSISQALASQLTASGQGIGNVINNVNNVNANNNAKAAFGPIPPPAKATGLSVSIGAPASGASVSGSVSTTISGPDGSSSTFDAVAG